MPKNPILACVLFSFGMFLVSQQILANSAPLQKYQIILLSPPAGYSNCSPIAVNDKGIVIGNITQNGVPDGPAPQQKSFIYANGKMTVFPDYWLFALNNKNTILGRASRSSDAPTLTLDVNGTPTTPPNCPDMWPKVITDSGIIAGDSTGKQPSQTSQVLPFTYLNGKTTWYKLPPNYTGGEVRAVDRSGKTSYGNCWSSGAMKLSGRAVRWNGGKVQLLPLPTLPVPDESVDTGILGVDDKGDILCDMSYKDQNGQTVRGSYMVEKGKATVFISPNGLNEPTGISPTGVLYSSLVVQGSIDDPHAYIDDNNKATILNSLIDPNLGWKLQTVSAISGNGHVAGVGTLNGIPVAFFLVPTK